jgi:hypothetical protein
VSGRRESLAPRWMKMLVRDLLVMLKADSRTEEDGEESDVLLSGLGDRLAKDLVLSVAECIGVLTWSM